ncbi:MAG: methyltransferase domain-containing protein [Proteobacteria bacterium]|nr:methyltransferase domain-containing protein [Pseudomonadota bacterium]
MDHQKMKEFFKGTFNAIATGYDNPAMRFFSESADRVSSYLDLKGNEHVLDVATGTGAVALAIAGDLPEGHVTGIDFSKGMLSQAIRKKEAAGICNASFVEMDMQEIDFPDNYFDAAVNSFGLFFMEDMERQLAHIADKVKPGGKVLMSTFYDNSFTPLVDLFRDRLVAYGVQPPSLAWKRVATEEQCIDFFQDSGLGRVSCDRVSCGYFLDSPLGWWDIVWNGGFRGLVNQVSPDRFEQFKTDHLFEVEQRATDQGIWLEMGVLYTLGVK